MTASTVGLWLCVALIGGYGIADLLQWQRVGLGVFEIAAAGALVGFLVY